MADAAPAWADPVGPQEKVPDWASSPAPQKKSGFLGPAGISAGGEALRVTGAVGGGEAGAEVGAALGAFGGPAAPFTVPAGAILGGLAGGIGGYYGMGKLGEKTGLAGREAEAQKENPTAFAMGSGAIDALTGGYGLVQGARALAPSVARAGQGLMPRTLIEKIAKPSTISDVGEKIHTKLTAALKALTTSRAKEADNLFDAYKSAGKSFEDKILADYQKALTDWRGKNLSQGSLSHEEDTAVQKSFLKTAGFDPELGTAQKDAAAAREAERQAAVNAQGRKIPPRASHKAPSKTEKIPPGIGALEKERRVLNDKANGMEVVGAEGISARAAKEISDLLTKSIRKYVPKEFDAAMEGYKKASEPVNRYATALGSKITKTAHEYLPDMPKTDPAQVPRAFFKSRRSVQELKDLSGDAKFVEQAAKEHVANDLIGAKTSAEVGAYMQKNRDWLQEFPQLQKQLTDTAKTLKSAERAKTVGKVGAGILGLGAADATVRKILGGF